ncbi:AHH domain-containing protein [Corallococcus sp. BB11-1]|uniref:AHH domain-containing protein n=1 Tax=Corallococcus sp. BB11-1 TaxID=2996783 RepID=UPI00226F0B9E|nr:AHH domain-containing protein [Corallococcus sp. BB11-1]MCY1035888.1 AHH domain-containing protein [Corallococcus sp. BB11-1]
MSHDTNSPKKKSPKEEHLDAVQGRSHHFTQGFDGGKCLWRGLYKYSVHSCSYRYQAHGRATEDKAIYNWPAYQDSATGKKTQTDYRAETGYPRWYSAELDAPTATGREWGVKGKNFKGGLKPYWNDAHHLIPIGALEKSLEVTAGGLATTRLNEGKERMISASDIRLYFEEALLRAGYNINHKSNMLILPMDNAISHVLRLPKHGGPTSNNHVEYNRFLKDTLDEIMDNFRDSFSDLPDKEHLSDKDRRLQKMRLERLSEKLYAQLTKDCLRGAPPLSAPYVGAGSLEERVPGLKVALESMS